MQILAKASLNLQQINSKLDKGATGIEIQLLDEFIENKNETDIRKFKILKSKDVFKDDFLINLPDIYVVHAPLLSYVLPIDDINIEQMTFGAGLEILNQIFITANRIGEIQNRKILIVIHSEMYYEQMVMYNLFNNIANVIEQNLINNPYTEVLFENVTPLRIHSKALHLANNFAPEIPTFVKTLNKELETNRIGTVLDTCHAEVTNNVIKQLYKSIPVFDNKGYSLEDYFKANKDTCKLIHLSLTKGHGYGKGKHGQPFADNERSRNAINNFFDLYKKYNYNCLVTLEVAETDYLISDGFGESFRILKEEALKRDINIQ